MSDISDTVDTVRSPIIMKIDGPDDNSNSNESETENVPDSSLPTNWVCTSSKLKLKPSNPFMNVGSSSGNSSSGLLKPSFLRPSQLLSPKKGTDNEKSHSGPLAPSRLNPFIKAAKGEELEDHGSKTVVGTSGNSKSDLTDSTTVENADQCKVKPVEVETKVSGDKVEDAPSVSSNKSNARPAVVSNFVFGENVHARVVTETPASGAESNGAGPSGINANGTSENLFTSLLKKDGTSDAKESTNVSLTESAKAYEESRANKRKYDEVEVITGEEGETNVLQFNCKLFAFHNSIWQERGRGTIRLNDKNGAESRLVWRNVGSHRVMLNTQIWSGMTVERASQKSLRITAMDSSAQIKVFLVMAGPKEIDQLEKSLTTRVAKAQSKTETKPGTETDLREPEIKKQAI